MILAQENSHAIFIDLLINIVLFEKIVELKTRFLMLLSALVRFINSAIVKKIAIPLAQGINCFQPTKTILDT
jgi:hypothetical protein